MPETSVGVAPGSAAPSLVAAVTVFRPDHALLAALLDRLLAEGLSTLAYIDGPTGEAIEADLLAELAGRPGLTLVQAPANGGIGAGLNALAARAREAGACRVLIFDQDSLPEPGMAAALDNRMTALAGAGERPAAIGPKLLAPSEAGTEHQSPRYRPMPRRSSQADATPVRYLISSGTLLDLAAFDAIGPFRADYVIDAIDTEWCFRAWARGYSVWMAEDVTMEHRVGRGVIRVGPLRFPRQNPDRMATYIRNQAHGFRLPHVPLGWKLRNMLYLPLQMAVFSIGSPRRGNTFARLVSAALDGLAGRLGRPRP
jgi:rhamnosyltransferase